MAPHEKPNGTHAVKPDPTVVEVSGTLNSGGPGYSKVTVIEAGRPASNFWSDVWEHRELLYLLAWRDISVRYKQTVLGIVWAVLRPMLTTLVLVVVFSVIVRAPSEHVPYALLVLSGLLPWQLMSTAVSAASESLLGNSSMLSKVYFPRLLFPLSAVATAIMDFALASALFALLMVWYGVLPGWRILALIPLLLLALCLAVSIGIGLSAANARYRDVRYVVPFFLQLGIYLSPVGYATTLVPERWRLAYALNPAVGIIEGFRWALLGQEPLNLPALGISCAFAAAVLVLGLVYFRAVEKSLVDLL